MKSKTVDKEKLQTLSEAYLEPVIIGVQQEELHALMRSSYGTLLHRKQGLPKFLGKNKVCWGFNSRAGNCQLAHW